MTKTHIIEQRDDGICFPVEYVYLVRQTQPRCDYINTTIYVMTDKDKAIEYARELNKEYGACCKFTDEYDFIEMDEEYYFDDVHYYDVETMKINQKLA